MAVTCVFILCFIWFYSGLLQRNFEPTVLFVDPAISDTDGISEFYEITFHGSFERVYTSTLCNSPATVTYFPNPPFITPALSRVSIVLTWSRSTGSVPYQPTTRPSVDHRSMTIAVLLLLEGDVKFNPGPQAPQRSADQLTASLLVGSFNCRSIVNKAAQIHDLIADRKLDILFLTETWLNSDMPLQTTSRFNITPSYTFHGQLSTAVQNAAVSPSSSVSRWSFVDIR